MGDDHSDNGDLTRIEDLTGFDHESEDEVTGLDEGPGKAETEEANSETVPSSFTEEVTQDIEIPENLDEVSLEEIEEEEAHSSNEVQEEASFEEFLFNNDSEDEEISNDSKESEEIETEFEPMAFEENTEVEGIADEFVSEELPTEVETPPEEISAEFTEEITDLPEIPVEVPIEVAIEMPAETIETPKLVEQEDFADVKKFATNITVGKMTKGGNPPYAIILKGIKYQQDAEDIKRILREHELIEDEKLLDDSMARGSILLSQLAEFSAVVLVNQFRHLGVEIQMGLSEEIHPSKNYDNKQIGLLNKDNIRQNKRLVSEGISEVSLDEVIVSTTSHIEGYKIEKYLGLITQHLIINKTELPLNDSGEMPPVEFTEDDLEKPFYEQDNFLAEENLEEKRSTGAQEGAEDYIFPLSGQYTDLTQQLKKQAIKVHANAIVDIQFHFDAIENTENYKISAIGSSVWISADES
jgi:uncharacterized protein YbjQ (UPF0145 family)